MHIPNGGEETKEDNPLEVRYEMRCNCTYDETCTLSGYEDEFNFYDYKTFRYAEIIAPPGCICEEKSTLFGVKY